MKPIALIVLISVCLFSCEDVIDIDLQEGDQALVVDSWITDAVAPFTVSLSATSAYFNQSPLPPVKGALVTITESSGITDTLMEYAPGIYQTPAARQAKIGSTYTLRIHTAGENFSAITSLKRVPEIDSLTLSYQDNPGSERDGYYLLYHGPEPEGVGDYYRFRITKNDTLQNTPEDLYNMSSDDLVDGNYIGNFQAYDQPLQKGDRVKAEVMTLTQDAYYFFTELVTQVNNGGMFSSPPANVRTNLINDNPDSRKKAIGYFGGSAVRSKLVVVGE